MPDTRKNLTVRLDPETWSQFRKHLIDQGLSIQQWFTAQVREALEKKEEK